MSVRRDRIEVSNTTKPKVYHGVLEEIRKYIRESHLSPGDKLPSERELAEKLNAGRSSVREALRALELLGLIETRHGEGTYLRKYRSLQTVELLSSFILLEDQTKNELLETKLLIEKEAAKLAFHHMDKHCLKALKQQITGRKSPEEKHRLFYHYLLQKADNQLLLKIWILLEEFSRTTNKLYDETGFYEELLEIFSNEDFSAIEACYERRLLSLKKNK